MKANTTVIEGVPCGVEADSGLGVEGHGGLREGFGGLREGWPKKGTTSI